MEHRAAGRVDVDDLAHAPIDVDHRVLDLVAPTPVVRHCVQLARLGIALRVRGVPTGQRAVEVAHPDGAELAVELVRAGAGFDDRERAAGVADHVGIGGEVHAAVHRTARPLLAERVGDIRRADEPFAVPLRLAVAQLHAVHHPVAGEPVVGRGVGGDGVRPVAQVAPVEPVGDRAGHLEVGGRQLVTDGRVVPFEVPVRHSLNQIMKGVRGQRAVRHTRQAVGVILPSASLRASTDQRSACSTPSAIRHGSMNRTVPPCT